MRNHCYIVLCSNQSDFLDSRVEHAPPHAHTNIHFGSHGRPIVSLHRISCMKAFMPINVVRVNEGCSGS